MKFTQMPLSCTTTWGNSYLVSPFISIRNKKSIILSCLSLPLLLAFTNQKFKDDRNWKKLIDIDRFGLPLSSTMSWDLPLISGVTNLQCLHWNAILFCLHRRFEVVVTLRGNLDSFPNENNVILIVNVK